MAVIVRMKVEDQTGSFLEQVIYRNATHPISKEEREQAEALDKFLSSKMKIIEEDLEKRGLLQGKRGGLERWYAVGIHLRSFVDNPSIVPIGDRMQDRYIWEAMWAHAPEGVKPGPPNTNTGTARDHFRLCYELAQFPPEVVLRFTWSDWVNFLETPAVVEDKRVTKWTAQKLPLEGRATLRELARVLRRQFRNRDLSVLNDDELEDELEHAWETV